MASPSTEFFHNLSFTNLYITVVILLVLIFVTCCCICKGKGDEYDGVGCLGVVLALCAFAAIAPASLMINRNDLLSDYNKDVSIKLQYLHDVVAKNTSGEISTMLDTATHLKPNLAVLVAMVTASDVNTTTQQELINSTVKLVNKMVNKVDDLEEEVPRFSNNTLYSEELRYTWTLAITIISILVCILLALGLLCCGGCAKLALLLMLVMMFVVFACILLYAKWGMEVANMCVANQEAKSVNITIGYINGMEASVNTAQNDLAEFSLLAKKSNLYPSEDLNPLLANVTHGLESFNTSIAKLSDELHSSAVHDTTMSLHTTVCDTTSPLAYILLMLLILAVVFSFLIMVGVKTGLGGCPLLTCLGCGSEGVRGGSYAARYQSLLGDVPAGSVFSRMQSHGASRYDDW